MKCPKCGYTSFDYLRECKKCGEILDDSRKALNLKMSEPTLFVGLNDEPNDVDKTEEIVESAPPAAVALSSSEADFSSSSLFDPLPDSQKIPTPGELNATDLSEEISSELGSLGSMDKMQPRGKVTLDDSSETKLELPNRIEVGGVELNDADVPLKGLELNDMANSLEEEVDKETDFALFSNDDKPVIENQLESNTPFEFSEDDLESDISLNSPTDTPDTDMIELELDMDDEESLDQILEGLETNDNSTK